MASTDARQRVSHAGYMNAQPSERGDRLDRRTLVISSVVVIGSFMSTLDTTIVNVALATLSRELHSPSHEIQWVATGYLVALAVVIPMTGWASERFGAKRCGWRSCRSSSSAPSSPALLGQLSADRLPRAAGSRRRHDRSRGDDDHCRDRGPASDRTRDEHRRPAAAARADPSGRCSAG